MLEMTKSCKNKIGHRSNTNRAWAAEETTGRCAKPKHKQWREAGDLDTELVKKKDEEQQRAHRIEATKLEQQQWQQEQEDLLKERKEGRRFHSSPARWTAPQRSRSLRRHWPQGRESPVAKQSPSSSTHWRSGWTCPAWRPCDLCPRWPRSPWAFARVPTELWEPAAIPGVA